jgi:hypothetical protein
MDRWTDGPMDRWTDDFNIPRESTQSARPPASEEERSSVYLSIGPIGPLAASLSRESMFKSIPPGSGAFSEASPGGAAVIAGRLPLSDAILPSAPGAFP